jgi:hypothetical protein
VGKHHRQADSFGPQVLLFKFRGAANPQRLALYNEVIELKQKWLSPEEIARRAGKSSSIIRRWL